MILSCPYNVGDEPRRSRVNSGAVGSIAVLGRCGLAIMATPLVDRAPPAQRRSKIQMLS
jgi:hypothetical protein